MAGVRAQVVSMSLRTILNTNQDFRVHSLFSSGVNLQVGNRLLYLGNAESGIGPFAVGLDEDALEKVLVASRTIGSGTWSADQQEFCWNDGQTLSLQGVPEYDGTMPRGHRPPEQIKFAAERLTEICTVLEKENRYGLDIPSLASAVQALKGLFLSAKPADTDTVLDFWVGRGQGLTPSGDDMLVGLLAVLYYAGREEACSVVKDYLDIRAPLRTTQVSCEYLYYGVRGIFTANLVELLLRLQPNEDYYTPLTALLQYGHTSGADTLLGVSLGYDLLWEDIA